MRDNRSHQLSDSLSCNHILCSPPGSCSSKQCKMKKAKQVPVTDGILETHCSGGKTTVFLQEKLVRQAENQVCLIGGNKAVSPCPLRNSTQPCGIGGFESSPDQNSSAIYRQGRGMLAETAACAAEFPTKLPGMNWKLHIHSLPGSFWGGL